MTGPSPGHTHRPMLGAPRAAQAAGQVNRATTSTRSEDIQPHLVRAQLTHEHLHMPGPAGRGANPRSGLDTQLHGCGAWGMEGSPALPSERPQLEGCCTGGVPCHVGPGGQPVPTETPHPGQFLFQQKEGPVLILKAPQIPSHLPPYSHAHQKQGGCTCGHGGCPPGKPMLSIAGQQGHGSSPPPTHPYPPGQSFKILHLARTFRDK